LFDGQDHRLQPLVTNSVLPAKIRNELEAPSERGKLLRTCQRAAFVQKGRIWGAVDYLWTRHNNKNHQPDVDSFDVLSAITSASLDDERLTAGFVHPLRLAKRVVSGAATGNASSAGSAGSAGDTLLQFMQCTHEPSRFPASTASSPAHCAICHAPEYGVGIEFACFTCGYGLCSACASWSLVATQNAIEAQITRDPIFYDDHVAS
jgi:hypothetical protein